MLTLVVTLPTSASTISPPVVPPADAVALTGKDYAIWSAQWWQYVLSYPTPASPVMSTTGAGCEGKHSAPTFYLVGSFVGPLNRPECIIPANNYVFFPLVNIVDVNTTNQTADELLGEIKALVDGAHGLHASVDGVVIGNPAAYRTTTHSGFALTLPGNNLLGLPAGSYSPAVADGYYLLLAPRGSGAHTNRDIDARSSELAAQRAASEDARAELAPMLSAIPNAVMTVDDSENVIRKNLAYDGLTTDARRRVRTKGRVGNADRHGYNPTNGRRAR